MLECQGECQPLGRDDRASFNGSYPDALMDYIQVLLQGLEQGGVGIVDGIKCFTVTLNGKIAVDPSGALRCCCGGYVG